jgi:PHP family Zn ribbon phosphoesterase
VELLEGDGPPRFDQLNIYMECKNPGEKAALLRDIHKRRVKCPVDGKNLRLGVRDRAMMIGTGKSISPQHRPLYLHVAPLLDVISASMNGMAKSTKTVRSLYDRMRNSIGRETAILSDAPIDMISQIDKKVGAMVEALRNGTATYAAGGGGRYGRLVPPWESGEAAN